MKRFFLCLTVCGLLFSCTDDDRFTIKEITLKADKYQAFADGNDKIHFTVTAGNEDLTIESKILVNNEEITGYEFTSMNSGKYIVTAKYNDIISNQIEISFDKKLNTNVKIEASKMNFVADGLDMTVFSCIDLSENIPQENLDEETIYFVNGQKITGKAFRTTTTGIYKVTAHYKTDSIPGIEVEAKSDFIATNKIFTELIAATWCPYCPLGLLMIGEIVKDKRVVAMTIHPRSANPDPFLPDDQGVRLYSTYGIKTIPTIMINRNRNWILNNSMITVSTPNDIIEKINPETKIGIAIETQISDNKIEGKAFIKAIEDMPNVKYVALLVENDLPYDQRNIVKPELGDPIKNFVHNHVYRSSYNNNIFGEPVSLTSTEPLVKNFIFTPDPYSKKENCEVIILISNNDDEVINVQKVKVGHQTGY